MPDEQQPEPQIAPYTRRTKQQGEPVPQEPAAEVMGLQGYLAVKGYDVSHQHRIEHMLNGDTSQSRTVAEWDAVYQKAMDVPTN